LLAQCEIHFSPNNSLLNALTYKGSADVGE
jgi:hypothetical protein